MHIPSLTITQYLLQGDPDGLVASYVSNWTGQCLKFPRNLLKDATSRKEFQRTGVYFLIAEDPTEINVWTVYVGESDGLDVRISEHNRKRKIEDWEICIVFSSKDDNLTKAHVRYLEHLLIEELKTSRRVKLENYNATNPKLPEASIGEVETYLAYLKMLMPVLGYPFFEKRKPGELGVKEQTLFLSVATLKAEGFLTPKGIVVKANSDIAAVATNAISGNYNLLRNTLHDQKVVDLAAGKFLSDYEFSSFSAAAAVIVGYNINGRNNWKNVAGQNINQMEQ